MNAVIYARYSSSNQREESIEGQIRECTKYAEQQGYTIIELTSQGKTYNEQTLQISNELKEKFFKNLSAEEIASLENTLSKISSNFE